MNCSASRHRNRRRRQSIARVRIIGGVGLQIRAPQVAVEIGTNAIDDSRVGLQAHAPVESTGKDTGDARAFIGTSGLFFDDRSQNQCLVGTCQRRLSTPTSPLLLENLPQQLVGLTQELPVNRAAWKMIGFGQKQSFGMLGQGVDLPKECGPAHFIETAAQVRARSYGLQ